MFKNYFQVAFRLLLRNKIFSAINIFGLAIGMASCLLISWYIWDEWSFDKHHINYSRIYRVDQDMKFGEREFASAAAPPVLGPALQKDFAQVEAYTRLQKQNNLLFRKGNENILEEKVAYADSSLFNVFTIPVITGEHGTALSNPNSLVITEKIALKYFGRTDVIGESILVNDTNAYKVTAVIKDLPAQSHFDFDVFVAMSGLKESRDESWFNQNFNTYILLRPGTNAKQFSAGLDKWMSKYAEPQLRAELNIGFDEFEKTGNYIHNSLMPLSKIHLYSDRLSELGANSNVKYTYIYAAIAVFILLIACVNYINLSTSQSSKQAKEVAVRKVMGSHRINIIKRFLSESILTTLAALLLSILFVKLLLPYFNTISGKELEISFLSVSWLTTILVFFVLFIGILAGAYPAFFLSSFNPVQVLKGKSFTGTRKSWLRNSLVVFQFWISITLIISTVIVYQQLRFIQKADPGFSRSQILVVRNTDHLGNNTRVFREEVIKIPGVEQATITGYIPFNGLNTNASFYTSAAPSESNAIAMHRWDVDNNYIPTLGIQLKSGRNFSPDFPSDSNAVIVNEAALKLMGSGDPLKMKLYNNHKPPQPFQVIGVMKDFAFNSLHQAITPMALLLQKEQSCVSVRLNTGNISETVAQIKLKWKTMAAGQPFNYSFMDEDFNNLYKSEQQTEKVAISVTMLAILIACLGLFGLAAHASDQRRKEISIRKVFGASVQNITSMLLSDFIKLVLLASVIAFPVAWMLMNKWLMNFAYRIELNIWVFILSALGAILITVLVIGFQAIKAAIANPADILRAE